MKPLLTIILLVFLTTAFGQNTDDNKYSFAKEVFTSDVYKPAIFQKFDGVVKKVGNTFYQFGGKSLKVSLSDTTILEIFTKGIFNPDIIFGKETTNMTQHGFDTLSQTQKVFYNLTRNDSLYICCFEQLEKLDPNPQTKRFKFLVSRIGMVNPTEYYLELKNDKANTETTLKEFLETSVMTFYYKGTIII